MLGFVSFPYRWIIEIPKAMSNTQKKCQKVSKKYILGHFFYFIFYFIINPLLTN